MSIFKNISLVCLLISYNSYASDEIERINKLANEVKELRINYDTCKEQLKSYTTKIEYKDNSNDICNDKISKLSLENKAYKENISLYENTIRKQEDELKNNKLQISNLENENQLLKKELNLLKLKLLTYEKDLHTKPIQKTTIKLSSSKKIKIIKIKPTTFKLTKDATIYDSINGSKITKWEKGTTFTSYIRTKNWIKITGYFIGRKWKKAKKEMWIKAKYTRKK